MLRSRIGKTDFIVVNQKNDTAFTVDLDTYLTPKQKEKVVAYPDLMWQFAQRLKKEYAKKGEEISVFVNAKVSINGRPYQEFIDPDTDLAHTDWDYFRHHEWILPSQLGAPTEK